MKKILLAGFGMTVAATAAMGEGVTATKKAAIMTPIENLYGRVEVRQTSMRWESASGKKQTGVTSYRLVPRLGTKAFNDRLDMYVETPIISKARTSNYEQAVSNYLVQFAALSGDIFSITPYAQGYLPHNGSDMTNDAAVNFDAGKTFNIIGGKLTLHGGIEPQVSTGTQASQTDALIVKNGSYSLGEDGTAQTKTVDQQEPTTILEYIAGFAFTPSAAPKFSLAADAYFDRAYNPTYELRSDESGERMEKTGYAIKDTTLTDIVLTYKADSLTSIQSLSRLRHDGLYAENKKFQGSRMPQIEQRLSLIHKLF